MTTSSVADLMTPLAAFPVMSQDGTLADAVRLMQSQASETAPGGLPARAVLVTNREKQVVGQIGHLDLLRALEPKYALLGDLDTLSRAGVSAELMHSLGNNLEMWEGTLVDICRRAGKTPVSEVMRPIRESVDRHSSLIAAMHKLVMWQTPRALVTDGGTVVGVLRLATVVEEIAKIMDGND